MKHGHKAFHAVIARGRSSSRRGRGPSNTRLFRALRPYPFPVTHHWRVVAYLSATACEHLQRFPIVPACDYGHPAITMSGYLPSPALFVLPLRAYTVGASLVFVVAAVGNGTLCELICGFWLVWLSPSLCLSLIRVLSYQWPYWLWLHCSIAFFSCQWLFSLFFKFFYFNHFPSL